MVDVRESVVRLDVFDLLPRHLQNPQSFYDLHD
jgi:hypothetical protein